MCLQLKYEIVWHLELYFKYLIQHALYQLTRLNTTKKLFITKSLLNNKLKMDIQNIKLI